jgi:hypothetical protein
MLPSPHEHTAAGGPTTPPAVLSPVVVTAVALTEGAALAAAMGAVESWNPLAYAKQDWRTCASGDGTTKEKPGFWTRRRAFVEVRRGSNIQLLSFSLVPPLRCVAPYLC